MWSLLQAIKLFPDYGKRNRAFEICEMFQECSLVAFCGQVELEYRSSMFWFDTYPLLHASSYCSLASLHKLKKVIFMGPSFQFFFLKEG